MSLEDVPFLSSLPLSGKPYLDAILLYFSFFLSRYPGNDIQVLCGNMFDTPLAKTLIVFVIMYSGSRDIHVAILMTLVCLGFQYYLSKCESCGPYVDKTKMKNVQKGVWITGAGKP